MNKTSAPPEIFTYAELKIKAQREIDRLAAAEDAANEIDAMDHALNAAFTVYHLLDWRHRRDNPNSSTSGCASNFCKTTSNEALKILEEMVTFNKHAEMKRKIRPDNPPGFVPEFDLLTEDEILITTENGSNLIGGDYIVFGGQPALTVLKNALTEFN